MNKANTSNPSGFNKGYLLPIAIVFAIIGMMYLLHSAAATSTVSFEPEDGTLSSAVQTKTGDDSSARYVTIGNQATNGGGLNPIPDKLANGNWYDISGNKFETTRLKLVTGSTTTWHVTNIQTYNSGGRATTNAGGVVSYFDVATGKDYVKSPSGTSGVLMTHFETGYVYQGSGGSFGGGSVSGNCVTSNYNAYNITACKDHDILKIVNNDFGPQAEEDKFYIPGTNSNSTFSIINTTKDISGQAALIQGWKDADDCGAAATGWGAGNAVTGFCVVQTMGGSMSSVFYKDHIIAGYYDKSTGHGVGMVWSKGYGDFFGEANGLKAWNPSFPAENFISWEYLTDNGPQTKYFFALNQGRSELEAVGKAIIDGQYF